MSGKGRTSTNTSVKRRTGHYMRNATIAQGTFFEYYSYVNNKLSLATLDDDPDSWVVPELLIRYLRAVNELNRRDIKTEQPLSPQQVRTLLYLVHHDGATIKELAETLCLSEARASRVAEELVEAGAVVRERDELDRRQVRLHVAPATAEKARRMYGERSAVIQAALEGAAEEELRIFTHYLRRLVEETEALAHRRADAERVFGDE